MPDSWQSPKWSGTFVTMKRGYPPIYSFGHASEEDALEAAELWEVEYEARKHIDEDISLFIG
jgi:hypothetical protein